MVPAPRGRAPRGVRRSSPLSSRPRARTLLPYRPAAPLAPAGSGARCPPPHVRRLDLRRPDRHVDLPGAVGAVLQALLAPDVPLANVLRVPPARLPDQVGGTNVTPALVPSTASPGSTVAPPTRTGRVHRRPASPPRSRTGRRRGRRPRTPPSPRIARQVANPALDHDPGPVRAPETRWPGCRRCSVPSRTLPKRSTTSTSPARRASITQALCRCRLRPSAAPRAFTALVEVRAQEARRLPSPPGPPRRARRCRCTGELAGELVAVAVRPAMEDVQASSLVTSFSRSSSSSGMRGRPSGRRSNGSAGQRRDLEGGRRSSVKNSFFLGSARTGAYSKTFCCLTVWSAGISASCTDAWLLKMSFSAPRGRR